MIPLLLIQLANQIPAPVEAVQRRDTIGYDAVGTRGSDARNPGL